MTSYDTLHYYTGTLCVQRVSSTDNQTYSYILQNNSDTASVLLFQQPTRFRVASIDMTVRIIWGVCVLLMFTQDLINGRKEDCNIPELKHYVVTVRQLDYAEYSNIRLQCSYNTTAELVKWLWNDTTELYFAYPTSPESSYPNYYFHGRFNGTFHNSSGPSHILTILNSSRSDNMTQGNWTCQVYTRCLSTLGKLATVHLYYREEPCEDHPCVHGECTASDDWLTKTCDCSSGYHGDLCDRVNPCQERNPCVKGNYVPSDDFLSTTCVCSTGYTGDLCDIQQDTPKPSTMTLTRYEITPKPTTMTGYEITPKPTTMTGYETRSIATTTPDKGKQISSASALTSETLAMGTFTMMTYMVSA